MRAKGNKDENEIKKINPSVLENSEELFFYLLEDERLFNRDKFRKALLDEKGNNVAKYNNEQKEKREKKDKEANNKSLLGKDKDKSKNTSIMLAGQPVQKQGTADFGLKNPQKDLRADSLGAQGGEQQPGDPKANDTSNMGMPAVKGDGIKDKESLAVFLNSHNAKKADASKKEIGQINIYGEQMLKKTKVPMWSFFQDLNYGDMAIVFNNPYYDFMLKERQELDLYRLDYLEVLSNREKGRVDMSPTETRKQEKNKQEQKDKIIAKYKLLLEQKKDENRRIDLYDAFEFYKNFMEGKADAGDHQRKENEQLYRREALMNALIFFSDRYYVNDMKRIEFSKQPYSPLSAYSLRDFLRDPTFEFRLFHEICFTRFYLDWSNKDRKPEYIKMASRPSHSFLEKFFATTQIKYSIPLVAQEESNYFLVRRYDNEEWSRVQYECFQHLNQRLKKETLSFYNECVSPVDPNAPAADLKGKSQSQIRRTLTFEGYAEKLWEVSGLNPDTVNAILVNDMKRQGFDKDEFQKYFAKLIVIDKVKYKDMKLARKNKLPEFVAKIRRLEKAHISRLMFAYKEGAEGVLKGFTIDERIFHNLLRKLASLNLNMEGIWNRQTYSSDFSKIFMVLKPQDEIIKQLAEEQEYPMQTELGMVDLLSLEPVDDIFRPFRLKDRTFKEMVVKRIGSKVEDIGNKVPEAESSHIEIPQSTDKHIVARTISNIESKNDETFEVYLASMHVMTERTLDDMKQIAAMKCLGDKNLFAKPKEDRIESREHQEAYYIFAGIVRYWHKMFQRMINTKDKAERAAYESLAGLVYRLIYLKAYGATNNAYDYVERTCLKILFCCRWRKRNRVQHLWDRIEVAPIAPFADYDPSHSIWRTYQTNERKDRNAFRSMDRIKLLNGELENTFNLSELQANRIVSAVLPLHDNYILKGESRLEMFDKFDDVYNYADPPSITEKKAQINMLLEGMADESESVDFVRRPLLKAFEFNFFDEKIKLDIRSISSYFGEKMGLYFTLRAFHTTWLRYLGTFGIIVFIVDQLMESQYGFRAVIPANSPAELKASYPAINLNALEAKDIALIVFKLNRVLVAIVTVIWTTSYTEHWKREQKQFAISHGMLDFEERESVRANFVGYYERDFRSNNYNYLLYSSWKRGLKRLLSKLIIFVLILTSAMVAVGCMTFRAKLDENKVKNPVIVYFLPSFLNYIFITLLNRVFNALSLYLNNKENYETLTTYEDELITKTFVFSFFNSFISYFLIAFVEYAFTMSQYYFSLIGYCTTTGPNFDFHSHQCYQELNGHATSFFICTFGFNFLEFLTPKIISYFIKPPIGFKRTSPWAKIDEAIEHEFSLQNFMITSEVDSIMYDYKEITIQFTSLSFFGIVFPVSFFLGFITSLVQIVIDRSFVGHFSKRPIPRSVSDIGNWEYMLEMVTYLTIFVNMGITVFTCDAMREIHFLVFDDKANYIYYNDEKYLFSQRLKYFVIGVFILLAIKQLLAVLIEDIPENLRVIQARHKNIINKFINKSRESNSNAKSGMPMHIMPSDIGMLIEGANAADKKGKGNANKDVNQASANPNSVYNKIKFNPADFATDFNADAPANK